MVFIRRSLGIKLIRGIYVVEGFVEYNVISWRVGLVVGIGSK